MKALKFNTVQSNQNVFFASDFHLSHLRDFIWKPRGYVSHVEHTKAVIAGINEKVGVEDVLFYLGDFSLNSTPEETKNYFRQIKCKNVFFIWGNHESSTSQIYNEALREKFGGPVDFEAYPVQWENVTFLGREAFIAVNKQTLHLHHFAHLIWDSMQHGVWHLCGHSHGNCELINPDNKDGKILDVGVDNAIKQTGKHCFSFAEVAAIMNRKDIVVVDHHDKNTT